MFLQVAYERFVILISLFTLRALGHFPQLTCLTNLHLTAFPVMRGQGRGRQGIQALLILRSTLSNLDIR